MCEQFLGTSLGCAESSVRRVRVGFRGRVQLGHDTGYVGYVRYHGVSARHTAVFAVD